MLLDFFEKIHAHPSRIDDMKMAIAIVSESDQHREELTKLFR